MKELINKLKNLRKLAAVYSDYDNCDKFTVGYILKNTSDELLILNISPCGKYDGFSVIRTDDIYRIEHESLYLKKIERLTDKGEISFPEFDCGNSLMDGLMKYSMENEMITLIKIGGGADIVTGFVSDVTDEFVCLKQISDCGEYDGMTLIGKEQISFIASDDEECRCIKRLYMLTKIQTAEKGYK